MLLLIFFLIASLFCFTIPGIYLLTKSKINFSFWEKTILGTVLGFTFFTLLSYLLLVTKLSFLLIPIILFVNAIYLKKNLPLRPRIVFLPKKKLILLILIFLFGITGQMLVIAPSGLNLNGDLIFWSSHAHDGSWHISLMEEIKKGYPLKNPVYAGERLVNYHFFSDIAPAVFNQYFKFSTLDLYFRFFPLFFSILLGAIVYLLGVRLGGFTAGIWSLIFTYFAGSFGYIVTYFKNQTIGGESIFWASQIQSSIGNPPQIVSFIIILNFLYLFRFFITKKDKVIFFILLLLTGSLVEFKVYGAVVLLGSLTVVGMWQLVKERKILILSLAIVIGTFSAVLYLPNTSESSKFLIFEPWWFIRTMVVAPDRLDWLDLELKRQTYIFENNWKRVIQVESTAFLIFFFGNLGLRFLGLFAFWQMSKTILTNYFSQLFILITVISFILPLLFLQKGVASNTIQFLQYFLLLFGILTGLTVSKILNKIKKNLVKVSISLLLIIIMIPTQAALIYSFYSRPPFAKIHSQELLALEFLKKNSDINSVILTPPYNKYFNLGDRIPNIWDWYDTAYVSALSTRRTYLADFEQVDIMGYDLKQRLSIQEEIFTRTDPLIFTNLLKEKKIDYLYFPKPLKPAIDLSKTLLKKVYANDVVEIWKIDTKEDRLE